ncbi:replication initiation protein [Pontibacter sp. G13]|uniref:replication initiation protein n=1 Tax=Pontibacter sp. G13 TaxID=3074898 RepID=UPI0028894AF9|nr:replication initiation protein [Pontibacter sp. G13]WNJ21583.1 replication initiation protein [Pontibacter sp. G13]
MPINRSKQKSPVHYTVFQPNVLIGANSDMKLMELRLYTEILNINHSEEPDQLTYHIPYEAVTESEGRQADKNLTRDFMRLTKMFQKRVFDLDKDFMEVHFGESYPVSIVPFPRIRYREKMFEITIEPYFKAVLVKLDLGFTKGDIEMLRGFRHTYSHRLYWVIRQNQWRRDGLTLSLVELKAVLGCDGKYPRYNNFRKDVLEPVRREFEGTWVEFEYHPIRKGRGGAVREITLEFKDDLQQMRELKLGEAYSFEKILAAYEISPREIRKIRQNVTMATEVHPGFVWNEDYVIQVIEMVRELDRKKHNSKDAKPIKHMGAYILKILNEGWFIEQIQERRKLISKTIEQQLDLFPSTSQLNRLAPKQPPVEFRTTYASFREMYELNQEINPSSMTEAEFAANLGYEIHGDWVVKIQH